MTFKFCELSAAIGYATCYYENHEDSDLDEALTIAVDEFIPSPDLDEITVATMFSHLDIATKEYQSDRNEDEDEDEDEDEE